MVPAISHPLYHQFRWLVQSAIRDVRELQSVVWGAAFIDLYPNMDVHARGSVVGACFQEFVTRWLMLLEPGNWRKGAEGEPDMVCLYNPDFNFEIKTSCNRGNTISGNKVQSTASKAPCFLLYVNYNRETLTLRDVRIGWIRAEDWIAGGQSSQSARLSSEARNGFFRPPDTVQALAHAATAHYNKVWS
jgi:hypothetical protein